MAKKIGAIVSLSIIGILIIATIIMANVSVNYRINCKTPSYVIIDGMKLETAETNKIVEYINNASKEKTLTALFNGNLNKKPQIKVASSVGKTLPTNSDAIYVRYRYEEPQKLMNGKKAYEVNVYYDDLVFEVKNATGENTFNVYVIEDKTNSNSYTYYYELDADFEDLYAYLQDITPGE